VNPYSSTNADVNPTDTGLALPTDSFPKADPTQVEPDPASGAPEINLITWRPYTNDLDASGYLALRGDGQVLGSWNRDARPPKFDRAPREPQGTQAVIALTDSAAAAKYQVITASLRNPANQFVSATPESMAAAAAAMTASTDQPQVMGFDMSSSPSKAAKTAYPMTMPVYAAASPYLTDAEARASYASFIRYVATSGQVAGVEVGQLPAGYAPMPQSWTQQALVAATALESGLTRPAAPVADDGSAANGPAANGVPNAPSAAAPAAVAPPVSSADSAAPSATGAVAGALSGAATPADPDSGGLTATLPISILAGLGSAAAVLLIPRLPRRA
jgi:hypothetical protein